MLKMDQVHVLRHQVLNEGRSIRRVARELGISRNTVADLHRGDLELSKLPLSTATRLTLRYLDFALIRKI